MIKACIKTSSTHRADSSHHIDDEDLERARHERLGCPTRCEPKWAVTRIRDLLEFNLSCCEFGLFGSRCPTIQASEEVCRNVSWQVRPRNEIRYVQSISCFPPTLKTMHVWHTDCHQCQCRCATEQRWFAIPHSRYFALRMIPMLPQRLLHTRLESLTSLESFDVETITRLGYMQTCRKSVVFRYAASEGQCLSL